MNGDEIQAARFGVATPSGVVEATERLFLTLLTAATAASIVLPLLGAAASPIDPKIRSVSLSIAVGLALAATGLVTFANRRKLLRVLRRRPQLALLEAVVYSVALALVGGWRNSFYVASYVPVFIAAASCGTGWTLACALTSATGYVAAVFLNDYSWHSLQAGGNADLFVASIGGYFAAALLTGVPSAWMSGFVVRINRFLPSQPPQVANVSGDLNDNSNDTKQQPRRSTVGRTASLSTREVEVVQLVADGLKNHQIAERLGLSPRTVQAHIANALEKTGTSSRTQLAVLGMREGIVPYVAVDDPDLMS